MLRDLLDNQVFIGGVGAIITGSLLFLMKSIPLHIWNVLLDQLTVSLTIRGDEEAYHWFSKLLASHPRMNSLRNLMLIDQHSQDNRYYAKTWNFHPGYGVFYIRFGYTIIRVIKVNEKEQQITGGYWQKTKASDKDKVILTTFGRSQEPLRKLIAEAEKLRAVKDGLQVYIPNGQNWGVLPIKAKRDLDSIYLPKSIKTDILSDANWFYSNKTWFKEKGIPHRRGYLFHGLPGTGKTSLAAALASHLNKPLYYLNLNSVTSDQELSALFQNSSEEAIYLIEDIDCSYMTKDRVVERDQTAVEFHVTLSGLLNAIDGIVASEGRILIMTTNHVQKLDTALIRPGRIDRSWEFSSIAVEEAIQMIKSFCPDLTDEQALILAKKLPAKTPAELQCLLMCYLGNSGNLLEHYTRLTPCC